MKLIILSGSRSENSNEFWRILWLFSERGEKSQAGQSAPPPIRAEPRGGRTAPGTEHAILRALMFLRRLPHNMPAPEAGKADFGSVLANETPNKTVRLPQACKATITYFLRQTMVT